MAKPNKCIHTYTDHGFDDWQEREKQRYLTLQKCIESIPHLLRLQSYKIGLWSEKLYL